MKKAALLLSGLLLSAFASVPASAEQVRVRLTARVSQISDPNGVLVGKIVVGQRVNGLYVYNTNTPNASPFPGFGDYRPYANEGRVRFAMGGMVFESKQPTQGIGIFISPENFGSSGTFNILSNDNKPLADGTEVQHLQLVLAGFGNVTQSVELPNVAPNLQQYTTKEVTISAHAPGDPSTPGGSYQLQVQIEAAELVVADAIVLSPASGTFAANQHFDAAVILPRNSTVSTAQATANGHWLPLSYPGSCQLQPQVGSGKPSLLCPNADAVLSVGAGAPIVWTVELTNGTVLTETVNWERAP